MTDDYSIHPDAPLDSDGYPVHPERGHHICARTKSDRTTPTEHGRERDDYPYCLQSAGHGTTNPKRAGEPGVPCSNHGGDSLKGEEHPNHEHGAYSKFTDFVYDSLTDREREAVEAIDFDDHGDQFAKDVVKEAYAKYVRTGDDRFLREARQWASEFGVIERPADQLEVSAEVESEQTLELDDEFQEIVREVLRQRRSQEADTDE